MEATTCEEGSAHCLQEGGTRGRAHPLADKACARTVPGSLLPPGLFLLVPLSGTLIRAAPLSQGRHCR